MGRHARVPHQARAATAVHRRDRCQGGRATARLVADRCDGAIGTDGACITHRRRRPAVVRQSLYRCRARRGERARCARVLSRHGRVAPLRRCVRCEPSSLAARSLARRISHSSSSSSAAFSCGGLAPGSGLRCAASPGSREDFWARRVISTGTTRSDSGPRFRSRSSWQAAS